MGSQATGCEIRDRIESQLLSTEKQDETKVTAVRYFYCQSSLFLTHTLTVILVTWCWVPFFVEMLQDNLIKHHTLHTLYFVTYLFFFIKGGEVRAIIKTLNNSGPRIHGNLITVVHQPQQLQCYLLKTLYLFRLSCYVERACKCVYASFQSSH